MSWRVAQDRSSEFTKRQQSRRLRSTLRHYNRIPPDWGVTGVFLGFKNSPQDTGRRLQSSRPPVKGKKAWVRPTRLLVKSWDHGVLMIRGRKENKAPRRTIQLIKHWDWLAEHAHNPFQCEIHSSRKPLQHGRTHRSRTLHARPRRSLDFRTFARQRPSLRACSARVVTTTLSSRACARLRRRSERASCPSAEMPS